MKFRPQVFPWLAGTGVPALFFYGGWLFYGHWLFLAGFVLFAVLTVFLVYFFRDPSRTPATEAENSWLAPADGVVQAVEQLEDDRSRIVIFLSIFNVHINRMPVAGTIEEINYTPGDFLPAYREGIEEKNERNAILCRDDNSRKFELHQIAGVLARRIYCWLDENYSFFRGERCGMIALSSRTDLVLPAGVEPVVETGAVVRAGETEVARG
ncbi:MAG: phosphatidylserine decarboxylase [bacterium]